MRNIGNACLAQLHCASNNAIFTELQTVRQVSSVSKYFWCHILLTALVYTVFRHHTLFRWLVEGCCNWRTRKCKTGKWQTEPQGWKCRTGKWQTTTFLMHAR